MGSPPGTSNRRRRSVKRWWISARHSAKPAARMQAPGLRTVLALEAIGSEVPGVELPALPAFPERPPAGEEIAEGEGSGAAQNVELIPPVRLQADDHARPSGTTAPSVSASRGETGSNSDTPPAPAGAQLDQPVSRREPPDIPAEYGGMIGAVESWASEGTVVVNAGRLYRLINRIAATRTEAAALSEMVASGARRQPEPNGFRGMVDGLALATEALQSDVLGLASLPLSTLTGHLPQLVGYLAKKLGKNVELEITGDVGIVIDRHVVEAISEPVRQLIVNAIYHGLEIPTRHKSERKRLLGRSKSTSLSRGTWSNWWLPTTVRASIGGRSTRQPWSCGCSKRRPPPTRRRSFRCCSSRDSRPEPSTVAAATGSLALPRRLRRCTDASISRREGDGTRVTVRIPVWQALQKVLIVWAGGMRWAIPESAVDTTIDAADVGVVGLDGRGELDWAGRRIPLVSFAGAAGLAEGPADPLVIVLSHRVGSAALTVAGIEGSRDVAVTELAPVATGPEHVTGVALLGAGEVAFVVDAGRMVERTRVLPGKSTPRQGPGG